MNSDFNKTDVYIKVNDIFDELSEENKRLNNELMFANISFNVLNKLKIHLNKICLKFETIIESEDKQELNRLEDEFNSLIIGSQRSFITNEISFNQNVCQSSDTIIKTEDNCTESVATNAIKRKKRLDSNTTYVVSVGTDHQISDYSDNEFNHNKKSPQVKQRRDNQPKSYICSYDECGKRFQYKSILRIHTNRFHIFAKSFKCEECHQRFYTSTELKDHQSIHSGIKFECEECHQFFKKQSVLKSHQKTHLPNRKTFSCNYCDITYKSNHSLQYHIRLKHIIKDRSVECDYAEDCHKMFKDIKQMNKHKRQCHHSERVSCEWPGCDETYKSRANLARHRMAVHIAIREFVCDVEGCGKTFLTKDVLGQHIKYHEKRFFCEWPECGQQFAHKENFKNHMNRHQNIKPFKCSFNGCQKEFFTRLTLRYHMKTVHKTI